MGAGPTITVDETVSDGDTIDCGSFSLRVMATPGHSDCSTSFFDAERRILVSADVTPYYISAHDYWWPNYFTGYAAYVASMERLAALGAEIVCLGHTATIRGADEATETARRPRPGRPGAPVLARASRGQQGQGQ